MRACTRCGDVFTPGGRKAWLCPVCAQGAPLEDRVAQALADLGAECDVLAEEWGLRQPSASRCEKCGAPLPASKTKPRRWCSRTCMRWGSRIRQALFDQQGTRV